MRPRTFLRSESNLSELLDNLNGREQLPGHVRKHISVCVDNLIRKVDKSLNLILKNKRWRSNAVLYKTVVFPLVSSRLRSVWMFQTWVETTCRVMFAHDLVDRRVDVPRSERKAAHGGNRFE